MYKRQTHDREKYKRKGELISANFYQLEKGMRTAKVIDYYDPECPEIEISLDVRLTPQQNAQKYFKPVSYTHLPTQTVTRNEFIAMAAAAADLELEDTTVTDFQDDSALSPWVKPYISAAAEAGLIQGYQTASGNAEIRGERAITISEAAVIVSNLMAQQQIPTAASTSDTISYRVVPAWACLLYTSILIKVAYGIRSNWKHFD